jgi:RNA polymerase-binding transcription factor DksA
MPGRKPTAKDLTFFEAQLRMMLQVISGDIDRLQRDTLGEDNRPEMQGDEGKTYAIEFSLELLQRDEGTVKEVIEALDRIESGTYGRCEMCDAWLRKERLKAMPHARHCIDCQRELEAEHG